MWYSIGHACNKRETNLKCGLMRDTQPMHTAVDRLPCFQEGTFKIGEMVILAMMVCHGTRRV